MDKPDVDFIEGLSPAISIDQKSASPQPPLHGRHDHRGLRLPPRCSTPASACRTARTTARELISARRRSRSSTASLRAARGHPLPGAGAGRCGAARATYDTLLTDLAGQGFARARVDGELRRDRRRREGRPPGPLRAAHHRGRRRPPGRGARASSAGSPTRSRRRCAWPTAWPRSRSWPATARGSTSETLTFSQHLACPDVRHAASRSWRPQLLVQLALRRLRALRRPRHAVRGRSRAGRPRPRPGDRRAAPSPVGAAPHPVLPAPARVGVPRTTASTSTCRGRSSPKKQQQAAALRHRAAGRSRSSTRTATGRQRLLPRARTRASSRGCSAATPTPRATTSREQIEGYMREVPCPSAAAPGLKPLSASASPIDGRSDRRALRDMSIGDVGPVPRRPRAVRSATG